MNQQGKSLYIKGHENMANELISVKEFVILHQKTGHVANDQLLSIANLTW